MATKTLNITKMLLPESKYSLKCPYSMTPTEITYHETANDASAMAEVSYMIRNSSSTSFHVAVDDTRAVQGIPYTRNAWACGDGKNGTGNRKSINVECCYSKSGGEKYKKARDNALTLIAMLMKQYKISATKVKYHKDRSGKNCPHRTISEGISTAEFQKLVQNRYNEMYAVKNTTTTKVTATTGTTYKVGDTVKFNGIFTSSNSTVKKTPAKKSGKITKIIQGAKNPYLIEKGNIGWTNSNCITGKTSTTKTTTTVSYYKKCSSKFTSISKALVSIGVSGTFANRSKIALKNNITNYKGTASQNIKMLNLLKNGKLKKI